jgi:hypothetical protein
MALALPEATEQKHMDHPDFRVAGKIFATLGYPDEKWGMVKLSPEYQHEFLKEHPKAFAPAAGAWGRGGSTTVKLKAVSRTVLRKALAAAWRNTAPKRLTKTE